jgi:hypothetical protein
VEGIHPASLAMLGILFAVALVGAAELAIGRLRQRRNARRWQGARDDVVIDLTYMHEAIRRDREQAERLRAASALNERRSTSPGGGGR